MIRYKLLLPKHSNEKTKIPKQFHKQKPNILRTKTSQNTSIRGGGDLNLVDFLRVLKCSPYYDESDIIIKFLVNFGKQISSVLRLLNMDCEQWRWINKSYLEPDRTYYFICTLQKQWMINHYRFSLLNEVLELHDSLRGLMLHSLRFQVAKVNIVIYRVFVGSIQKRSVNYRNKSISREVQSFSKSEWSPMFIMGYSLWYEKDQ